MSAPERSMRCWCAPCRCWCRSAPTSSRCVGWAASPRPAWSSPGGRWGGLVAPRVAVAVLMLLAASGIFFALFTGVSCLQFWFGDASEVANAFTYGGNTMTQYPLTIFPREVLVSLTFVFPIAFVNWYPCLYLLGRPDPFGMPGWFAALPSPWPRS
ncbi:MAG: ABC-2 family transporter protein [Nocardioides sp.]